MIFPFHVSVLYLFLSRLLPINSIIVFSPFPIHVSSSSTLYGKLYFSFFNNFLWFYRSNFFMRKFEFELEIGKEICKLHYRPHVAIASNRKMEITSLSIKSFLINMKRKCLWNKNSLFCFSSFSFFEKMNFPHVREMMKTHWASLCGLNINFRSLWSFFPSFFELRTHIDLYNCYRHFMFLLLLIIFFLPFLNRTFFISFGNEVVHLLHSAVVSVINIIAIIEFFRFNWDVMDF